MKIAALKQRLAKKRRIFMPAGWAAAHPAGMKMG